ncbi:hypothetical protein BSKO_02202 [Bryopsis sp. KO-2023]|nr:hypothetical protein BSKO_02202 [Bryopsis sp. KO-2023]
MPGITHRIKLLPKGVAACVHFGLGASPRCAPGFGIVEGVLTSGTSIATYCTIAKTRESSLDEPSSHFPKGFKPGQLLPQSHGSRLASTNAKKKKKNGDDIIERLGPAETDDAKNSESGACGSHVADLYARMVARRKSAHTISESEFERSLGKSSDKTTTPVSTEVERSLEKSSDETTTPVSTAKPMNSFTEVRHATFEKSSGPDSESEKADIGKLLEKLPADIGGQLMEHADIHNLIEVVMDFGRKPEALFADHIETLREEEITTEDIEHVASSVGKFGFDNRAGIEGTLHRISCARNREGEIYGLTLRIGKPIVGPADFLRDIVADMKSVLFLGPPGVGKTSVIRDVARVLSTEMGRRVMIVDTSNEIAGDGSIPHPIIGRARRLLVPDIELQFSVMIEAVQNHRPEVIIVDEIGRWEESQACVSIAQRGVQIIATAHGQTLENLMNNSPISGLVGGIQTVIVGDVTARQRAADSDHEKPMKKTVQERRRPAPFQYIIEISSRNEWIVHHTETSVDSFLRGIAIIKPSSAYTLGTSCSGYGCCKQVRRRDPESGEISKSTMMQSLEAPEAFSTQAELRPGNAFGTEVSHRKKLPPWEWFRSGIEIAIRRRLEAENISSSRGKVNEMSNSVISNVQKGLSHILGTPPLHIETDQYLEEPDRESTVLSGEVELWMRRTIAESESGVEMSEAEISSGSHILAEKALSQVQVEVSRLRAEGILSKLTSNGTVPRRVNNVPKKASSASAPNTSLNSSPNKTSGAVPPNTALKSSLLSIVKDRMPQQSEAKVVSVQKQLYSIMEGYLTELKGKPEIIGTRSGGPKMRIVAGPIEDTYQAYKHVLPGVVQSSKIGEERMDREAVRLLQVTLSRLGALHKNILEI